MSVTSDAICFSRTGLLSSEQFAADIAMLRPQIAPASHVCNLLSSRYEFMVGLAAAMLNGQVSILPSAAAPQAIHDALRDTEQPLILGGESKHHGAFDNLIDIPRSTHSGGADETMSALARSTTEIHVFTSGSTKMPERRIKDWKTLVGGAAVTEEILQRLGIGPGSAAILGTTPHQHMYGLEATVFLGLGFGHCVHDRAIFFPADIEAAIAEAQACGFERAVLVTSPAHMKFLEPTLLETPEICAVISATAPLSAALAERLESRGDLAVMEIYGSTETGSLSLRRTIDGDIWEPVAGFQLIETDEGALASAPHLAETCLLGDMIDLRPDGRFRLIGRTGDMIGIAGKRANLSALNAILSDTPHLRDGVVLRRRTEGDDQLAVIAVLDPEYGLSETSGKAVIRKQFLAHVDAVFAPRRICFVDSLPRSPTGKLAADDLERLGRLVWNTDPRLS